MEIRMRRKIRKDRGKERNEIRMKRKKAKGKEEKGR
jgi:hypothetical protein